MRAPLRFGLIGTGRIGQVHAANIAASEDAVLEVVCDALVDSARDTATRLGGDATADAADVFAADIDAVIIASPTPTHIDLLAAAIDAGVPVLCEKPIDLDIARVDGLRARAAASGVPIALGFNRRFDPQFADVHRRVAAGEIGRLEHLSITSRDPAPPPAAYVAVSGGIFRDMTIHDFDMARFFVPSIVSVTAFGANAFSDEIRDAGDSDSAVVVLRGSAGELVTLTNSRHSPIGYDQRLEAFGASGLLQVDNVELPPSDVPFFLTRYADAYRVEFAEFIALARGDASTSPTFEDGRAALVLADAATESAATGRTVEV